MYIYNSLNIEVKSGNYDIESGSWSGGDEIGQRNRAEDQERVGKRVGKRVSE